MLSPIVIASLLLQRDLENGVTSGRRLVHFCFANCSIVLCSLEQTHAISDGMHCILRESLNIRFLALVLSYCERVDHISVTQHVVNLVGLLLARSTCASEYLYFCKPARCTLG